MTIELKVEQGLVVRPSNEQLARLIQEPFRTRASRLGVTKEELMRRTGLSVTTITLFAGTGRRTAECGVGINTLAKIADGLNWPIDQRTFNERLSIGGGLLQGAIDNAIPQLRAWRNVDSYRDEEGTVRSMRPGPALDTDPDAGSRQIAPQGEARPFPSDRDLGVTRQAELNLAAEQQARELSLAEQDIRDRIINEYLAEQASHEVPDVTLRASKEEVVEALIETQELVVTAAALEQIAPATLKQYARCGISIRVVA